MPHARKYSKELLDRGARLVFESAYNSAGFAFGAWIALVTTATLSHRVLPAWTAWIGIPIAVISLVGPLAVQAGSGVFSPQGSFAVVVGSVFAVWLAMISVGVWLSAGLRGIAGVEF